MPPPPLSRRRIRLLTCRGPSLSPPFSFHHLSFSLTLLLFRVLSMTWCPFPTFPVSSTCSVNPARRVKNLWLVWRIAGHSGVRHISEVKLRRARLVLCSMTTFGGSTVYHPGIYPCHSGPLTLATPLCVGAMSTGDGFGHLRETAPLKLPPYGAL